MLKQENPSTRSFYPRKEEGTKSNLHGLTCLCCLQGGRLMDKDATQIGTGAKFAQGGI